MLLTLSNQDSKYGSLLQLLDGRDQVSTEQSNDTKFGQSRIEFYTFDSELWSVCDNFKC